MKFEIISGFLKGFVAGAILSILFRRPEIMRTLFGKEADDEWGGRDTYTIDELTAEDSETLSQIKEKLERHS